MQINRCPTCGGSMPWSDGDGESNCMMCGRSAVLPQRAEDYEADQVRVRARAVVSAQSLRFIKLAQRPVEISEIAEAIEVPISAVAEALDAAVARAQVIAKPSIGNVGLPVFELAR
ncbi:MAG: hypothetical protein ACKVVP_05575 [Chloroflexota bacterium]